MRAFQPGTSGPIPPREMAGREKQNKGPFLLYAPAAPMQRKLEPLVSLLTELAREMG
jgi:hypothetical protein